LSHPSESIQLSRPSAEEAKQDEMATQPDDSSRFQDYYFGLPGNPRLLARSSTAPWEIPIIDIPEHGEWGHQIPASKLAFVVTRHPLREKLDSGLRDNIRNVLATMSPCRWISVDYLRIGYDDNVEQNNPVVVLVTVEEGQVPRAEAQRIVDALAQDCRK
jgi:hypothetical protein